MASSSSKSKAPTHPLLKVSRSTISAASVTSATATGTTTTGTFPDSSTASTASVSASAPGSVSVVSPAPSTTATTTSSSTNNKGKGRALSSIFSGSTALPGRAARSSSISTAHTALNSHSRSNSNAAGPSGQHAPPSTSAHTTSSHTTSSHTTSSHTTSSHTTSSHTTSSHTTTTAVGSSSITGISVGAVSGATGLSNATTGTISTQREVTEARNAVVASIGNMLDRELTGRARLLHENNAAIEKQEKDVTKALEGLKKENDKTQKVVETTARKVKEIGHVQNWAEMLEREFVILEETLRLVRRGSGSGSDSGSWTGSGSYTGSYSGSERGMEDDDGGERRVGAEGNGREEREVVEEGDRMEGVDRERSNRVVDKGKGVVEGGGRDTQDEGEVAAQEDSKMVDDEREGLNRREEEGVDKGKGLAEVVRGHSEDTHSARARRTLTVMWP
ncbi:hypothetical protein QBC35DRAFT_461646 [Podospora australis]|uniref:Biogenesis of lysosome-related organelles complex 1 subunit 1 n=1 Tax=Podospora australis TaxID=1536484 RepID=A0AAN6X1M3_9PEZI|nr:hypothetical protein QBC35DRAFT_461646 [Podospora australis]